MLTAYDYPLAKIMDESGVDIILVGDSLANVVLGLESTKEVGMDVMIHHAKAVNRAVKNAMLVGDMPYDAYQTDKHEAVKNAQRFVTEAGCDAVKIEWFDQCLDVAQKIIASGIPVMGHVGLTPQSVESPDGFKVQGQEANAALTILRRAKEIQKVGCFSIVLECIPSQLADLITKNLLIPTIGIGAGCACDGQVLVTNDLLGLHQHHQPKFVKPFVPLSDYILQGVKKYLEEVQAGIFPDKAHSYFMKPEEWEKLNKWKD